MTAYSFDMATFDDHSIRRCATLMRKCFPKAAHIDFDYLKWLYTENPVGNAIGFNTFGDGELVAHVCAIPQRWRMGEEDVNFLLLLNVATSPDHRGKGLFLKLAHLMEDATRNLDFRALIGIANQNTIRGYEKMGWRNVGGLDARVSFGFESLDVDLALAQAFLYRKWDQTTLRWRLRNPSNPLTVAIRSPNTLMVEGRTSLPVLRVRAIIPNLCGLVGESRNYGSMLPAVYIGSQPPATFNAFFNVRIPDAFRPSPLSLVYFDAAARDVDRSSNRLGLHNMIFSFLDFDAF